MINTFPNWLKGFYFKIEDQYETMLLEEDETNPENVRFINSLGIKIGEKILVKDKEYFVKDIQLYSNMSLISDSLKKSDGFYFDLHVIVSETDD